jgi:hypothetical protein
MQWVRQLFNIPEQVIRVQVDSEPAGDVTIDSLMAMAGIFRTIPHLQASFMADFRDTMDALEKLPGAAHEDRIRLAQKACDLWRNLSIPHYSVLAANALMDAQRQEQEEKPKQGPFGPRTVM